jgi:hypothetical protein
MAPEVLAIPLVHHLVKAITEARLDMPLVVIMVQVVAELVQQEPGLAVLLDQMQVVQALKVV